MSAIVLFAGEDLLSAPCDDSKLLQAKAQHFRQSGIWEEVVQGIHDLTVKYDPLGMTGDQANAQFRKLWDQPLPKSRHHGNLLTLNASFTEADAPDRQMVAELLGIAAADLPEWLSQRSYCVSMMGFQPGFAYLEDIEQTELPVLARLDTPRQFVAAGSIGFLGGLACIYALDGPGGWPIIGRVREPLFRRDHAQPFLLKPGQLLSFAPV